jgi:hypothetical protein
MPSKREGGVEMSVDHGELFAELAAEQPEVRTDAAISVPDMVGRWLRAGPAVFTGEDRRNLDELCRQVDVRRKVSVSYGEGFARLDPEIPAEPAVVSGLVAVLLANAEGLGGPVPEGFINDDWGLKCVNSALKALELREHLELAPPLRAWALEALDRVQLPGSDGPAEDGRAA